MEGFVHGVSTLSVDHLAEALGANSGISKSEVARNWDYYRQRFERDPAQGTGPPSDHAPVVVDLT